MPPIRAIKIYGERNTGTNYLDQLLALNVALPQLTGVVPRWHARLDRGSERTRDAWFRVTRRFNLGWKHQCAPRPDQLRRWRTDGVLFLSLSKNPHAWALSMHKRPYHRYEPPSDLLTFVNTPWRATGRDNHSERSYASLLDMWNVKYRSYLTLAEHVPAMHLRYEDLLDDPEAVVEALIARFDLPRVGAGFQNVQRSTKEQGKGFDWYRSYYLEQKWRAKLPTEVEQAIQTQLDPQLVERVGYRTLAVRPEPDEARVSASS